MIKARAHLVKLIEQRSKGNIHFFIDYYEYNRFHFDHNNVVLPRQSFDYPKKTLSAALPIPEQTTHEFYIKHETIAKHWFATLVMYSCLILTNWQNFHAFIAKWFYSLHNFKIFCLLVICASFHGTSSRILPYWRCQITPQVTTSFFLYRVAGNWGAALLQRYLLLCMGMLPLLSYFGSCFCRSSPYSCSLTLTVWLL